MRLAPAVHGEQAARQAALRRQALVEAEQRERGARVLNRVVRARLDVQAQQVAGQEAQAEPALRLKQNRSHVSRSCARAAGAGPASCPGCMPPPHARAAASMVVSQGGA